MKIEIPDLELGDYCHGTKYSDCDPQDPWYVGFLYKIEVWENGDIRYFLKGTSETCRYPYRHCRRITQEEGKAIVDSKGVLLPRKGEI